MTNTLLIIIALLLAVRIVLQLRQGKRAFEKMYCAPSEVENCVKEVRYDMRFQLEDKLESMSAEGWELVAVDRYANFMYLFFTRKKIKNFLEE